MATGIPARLTASEGRRFGLTVGGVFAVLAVLFVWRHRPIAYSVVASALAVILIFGGLLLPTRLGPIHRAWMGLAEVMSKVTTPIVMAALFYLVFTPLGLLARLTGRNPLTRPRADSFWVSREGGTRSQLNRQF